MAQDLEAFEAWVGALLVKLSAGERRKLARKVGQDLRRRQAARMRAQTDPDGVSWAPRKPRAHKHAKKPVRFLYASPTGEREIALSSWRDKGDRYIGFDTETGAIRSFLKSRIVKRFSAEAGGEKRRPRGYLRDRQMMRRLRAKLKVEASAADVSVGFAGGVARVARIHQDGLVDAVTRQPGSPRVKYAERRLIGFSEADRQRLLDQVMAHLGV